MKVALRAGIALLALAPTRARADDHDWTFRTRALVTGSSDRSDPAGYEVYSAFALEAALDRALTRALAIEATVRTESREVDVASPGAEDIRLGSIELLPASLFLQARAPWWASVHPYVGAGLNLTVCWEKSGALDSTDLTPSLGPAVQLGLDVDLGPYLLFDVDLRWNLERTHVKDASGARLATLEIDPISLGVGIGVRF